MAGSQMEKQVGSGRKGRGARLTVAVQRVITVSNAALYERPRAESTYDFWKRERAPFPPNCTPGTKVAGVSPRKDARLATSEPD